MTTLETNPIAFFFSPFSPLLGTGVAGTPLELDAGTAALSNPSPFLAGAARRL